MIDTIKLTCTSCLCLNPCSMITIQLQYDQEALSLLKCSIACVLAPYYRFIVCFIFAYTVFVNVVQVRRVQLVWRDRKVNKAQLVKSAHPASMVILAGQVPLVPLD